MIGFYTEDQSTAIVTKATPPPRDSRAGRTWFHRGIAGLRLLLEKYWTKPERRYYIGEWHFHTAVDVEPSPDDIDQMTRISRDRKYNCPEPVSLIVGKERRGERRVRMFVFLRDSSAMELHPTSLVPGLSYGQFREVRSEVGGVQRKERR